MVSHLPTLSLHPTSNVISSLHSPLLKIFRVPAFRWWPTARSQGRERSYRRVLQFHFQLLHLVIFHKLVRQINKGGQGLPRQVSGPLPTHQPLQRPGGREPVVFSSFNFPENFGRWVPRWDYKEERVEALVRAVAADFTESLLDLVVSFGKPGRKIMVCSLLFRRTIESPVAAGPKT